jgi:hypothetical protein
MHAFGIFKLSFAYARPELSQFRLDVPRIHSSDVGGSDRKITFTQGTMALGAGHKELLAAIRRIGTRTDLATGESNRGYREKQKPMNRVVGAKLESRF